MHKNLSGNIITKGTKILLVIAFLCLLLSLFVPVWAAEENSYIENFQLLLIGIGIYMVRFAAKNPFLSERSQKLLRLSVPVWLILLGREVSWGRTLFTDPVTGGFIARGDLFYWPLVYPALALIIIITLFKMYKAGIIKEIAFWYANRKSLTVPIGMMLISIVLITVFDKNILEFAKYRHIVYEELSEVVFYCSLLTICYDLYIKPYRKD